MVIEEYINMMSKDMDFYNRIINILDKPYFKNLESIGVSKDYYGEIFSRIYNEPVTVGNRTSTIGNEISKVNFISNNFGFINYIEFLNGFWIYREYDQYGKVIYYENSNGDIIENNEWR